MFKRCLFLTLLTCQLTLAAPLPEVYRPGHFLAPAQLSQRLQSAEAAYRKQANQEGLLEVECLRLQQMNAGDPAFPARFQALRENLPKLRPGRLRARIYWLARFHSEVSGDTLSARRFEELALAEPGLPPTLKACWLSQASDLQKALGAMRLLFQSHPSSEVQWYQLKLQKLAQSGRDLEFSLALARLQLAEKEGWIYEQFQALEELQWMTEGVPYVSQYRQFPFSLKPSPVRDAMLLRVASQARDVAECERVLGAMQTPPPKLRRARELASYSRGEAPELRRRRLQELVDLSRRSRDVDEEITARLELANVWANQRRPGEAVRQCQAALQLRLEHPVPDPGWATHNRGSLTARLAQYLSGQQRPHQALAVLEDALEAGAQPRIQERFWMHQTCLNLARHLGDVPAVERHWLALVELLPHKEGKRLGWDYLYLSDTAPPGQSQRKSQLVAQARAWAEETLAQERQAGEVRSQSQAEDLLADILRRQGDRPGELAVWRELLNRSLREHNQVWVQRARLQLVYAYGNRGEFRSQSDRQEFAKVIRSILSDPFTDLPVRLSALENGCYLAPEDPETLAWADELVRLSKETRQGKRSLARALCTQAKTGFAFQRYLSALASLEEASRLDPSLPDIERQRAEILWGMGRKAEALDELKNLCARLLESEEPNLALACLASLAECQQSLGHDWQAEYESALSRLEARGETGESARNSVLFGWLQRLAETEQWGRGREVLARHPWRGSILDSKTGKLQEYPAWADLLPNRADSSSSTLPDSLPQVLDELRLSRPDLGQLLTLRSTNLKHLQSRLQPNDTLITYCQAGEQFYLLALRADGGFYRRSPLGARAIHELQQRYLKGLNQEIRGGAEAELYQLLVEPILSSRPDQRLLLVPTGTLWQLPFGALRDAQNQSLASRAEVVLLSSGDLLRLADNAWQPYRLSTPLAIGAPPAADLPGAYSELEEVARLIPGCQLRRGEQATMECLYESKHQWGLLHFASHANYRADSPVESEIQLHDAPLKLKQLSQLSLAEHTLVTLGCCLGGASSGQSLDEPVTLATGFSAAGAGTVVANLWRVDDEVARAFFASFYRELAAGSSPGRSFRNAQTECRKLYPKPRDWAGFFLLGNPT